jgi:hypothetical protein
VFSKNINAHTQEKELTPSKIFEATYWKVMKKTKNNFCCKKKRKRTKEQKKGEKIIWRWWQL